MGTSASVNPMNGHLGPYHVMAEAWNGTSWSQSPPIGAMGVTIGLSAVSCSSPGASDHRSFAGAERRPVKKLLLQASDLTGLGR